MNLWIVNVMLDIQVLMVKLVKLVLLILSKLVSVQQYVTIVQPTRNLHQLLSFKRNVSVMLDIMVLMVERVMLVLKGNIKIPLVKVVANHVLCILTVHQQVMS